MSLATGWLQMLLLTSSSLCSRSASPRASCSAPPPGARGRRRARRRAEEGLASNLALTLALTLPLPYPYPYPTLTLPLTRRVSPRRRVASLCSACCAEARCSRCSSPCGRCSSPASCCAGGRSRPPLRARASCKRASPQAELQVRGSETGLGLVGAPPAARHRCALLTQP